MTGTPRAGVQNAEHMLQIFFEAVESPMERVLKALDVNVLSLTETLKLLHKWNREAGKR